MEGSRPPKAFRGLGKRLRRIAWRGKESADIWLVVILVLFLFFVVMPWMLRQSHR